MNNDYRLHLNFLPVAGVLPPFKIYRKPRAGSEPRPDRETVSYSLPKGSDRDDRADFWVRASAAEDYEPYVARADEKIGMTRWALARALKDSIRAKIPAGGYFIPEKGFLDEVAIFMKPHAEGYEELVVQPYYLGESRQFGCLADFHFRKKDEVPFSRRIQQLSLMLDAQGRRNLNAYIDRYERIMAFVKARASVFSGLLLPGAESPIDMKLEFEPLPARQLQSKMYIFGEGRQSRSQFTGLRDHGPLHPLDDSPRILFMFREQDRGAARTLAIALRGIKGKEKFSFPGFQALFKSEFVIDGDPVVLPDLSDASMKGSLEAVMRRKAGGESFLPVLVIPEGDDNGYLAHKADFSHAGIPSQVCTLRVIQDEYALKWAIANIALQVFCKAGGQPWKVRPSSDPTLIIGISQSHKLKEVNRTRTVEKYFAFSVLTDNSGLFQSIQVLGDSMSQPEYLKQLRANLEAALVAGANRFARVVVHTSFRLKRVEIDAIQETVNRFAQGPDGADCQFAVVKVNHKCRFFGVNRRVNSLVPYEGSTTRLGQREYLVWFEGIFPDKPTVTKAFPGPTHLEFLRVSDGAGIGDADLLQDIVNLSGANWRGFNAKSAPVSVFYCHLVADLVHDFHERGLPLPQVQLIRPWFL
jgi:hypothetical protein